MDFKFKSGIFAFILVLSSFSLSAQADSKGDFSMGESLFRENRAEESIPYLKNAVSQGGAPKAYVYLSVAYYQLGMYQECLDICSQGMNVTGTDKKVLALNAGNTSFAMGDWKAAERWYSLAVAANRLYAPPVLNRANVELKQEKYRESLSDYKLYLDLSPNDRQKEEIQMIIALLEGKIREEDELLAEEQRIKEEMERQRLAEEAAAAALAAEALRQQDAASRAASDQALLDQQRAAMEEQRKVLEQQRAAMEQMLSEQREAEARRIAEAQKRAEEDAERRRKLLEDVSASLKNAETENMSAGSEGALDYGYESELE